MSKTKSDTIPLIGSGPTGGGSDYDEFRGGEVRETKIVGHVSVSKLQEQLEKLSRIVQSDALSRFEEGRFAVHEIKIVAEITASGELGFLVGGIEAEAKGSIEISFRRPSAKE